VLVQSADGGGVLPELLAFPLRPQVALVEALEPDEEAAEPAPGGAPQQPGLEDRTDRSRRLPQAAHPLEPVEEGDGVGRIAEEVVVEKIEVPSRQQGDLRERPVDRPGIEGRPASEEGGLVAEPAPVRAAARDHDRVGNQVEGAPDEVAPRHRRFLEGSPAGTIDAAGDARPEVPEELRPSVLPGAQEEGVGVRRSLAGERGDMQPPETDMHPAGAVMVRDPVGPAGGGDVDLDGDQVRAVLQVERLHVLVADRGLVVGIEVTRQGGQSQGGEEAVLDGAPEGAPGLGERGQDQFDPHRASAAGSAPNLRVRRS